tara:strand:+ start:4027 stop:4275 length:249 start_codon:yes stop_codon:yes gene_type:complete
MNKKKRKQHQRRARQHAAEKKFKKLLPLDKKYHIGQTFHPPWLPSANDPAWKDYLKHGDKVVPMAPAGKRPYKPLKKKEVQT